MHYKILQEMHDQTSVPSICINIHCEAALKQA